MNKEEILRHLRTYLATEGAQLSSTSKNMYAELQRIDSEDIRLGENPTYFYANMECNSTGVATGSFKGTETQRTVALDYVTDTYLFIDGHEGAARKGLSIFLLKEGEKIAFYNRSDAEKLAKQYGHLLHFQQFHDLNLSMNSHRLNRYRLNITKGPFSYPIRPILATSTKEKEITVGYVYEKNGSEYIIIAPELPEKKKSGCAPWMFLGFIFPPIFIVALFVMVMKER